jgi:hypothetical protein
MPQVHLTLFPDPIEVPDDEVEVLRAQGLIRDEPAAPAAPPAVTKPTPAKKDDAP